ncbi:protein of unknown function [Citrobacter amalonaticus]|nr:protein of unknown function [Citrobacter amalonaticus]
MSTASLDSLLYGQDLEFIYRVSALMTALLFTPEQPLASVRGSEHDRSTNR